MKKEIKQLYDPNIQDYYITIENERIYFETIYEGLTKFKENKGFLYITKFKIKSIKCSNNVFKIFLDSWIFVCKPRIIKINDLKRKCYNIKQCQYFLEENKIGIDKITFDGKAITIGQIFTLNQEIVELGVNNSEPIKEKYYEINIINEDAIYLEDLIGKNKDYINFTKESKFYYTKKRIEFNGFITNNLYSKKNLIVYGPTGVGKTVSLLGYRADNMSIAFYLNLEYISHLDSKKKIFDSIIDELSFCFNNVDLFNNFIEENLRNVLNNSDKYTNNSFICEMLKKIIKNREIIIKNSNKIFLVIIDQYKYVFDTNKKIKNILEIFQEYYNYQYLISCSMDEDNNREILYDILFSDEKNYNIYFFDSFDGMESLSSESKTKTEIALQFGFLPKYIEEINNEKEENMDEYVNSNINYIKNNINSFILSKINNTDIKLYKIVKKIMDNVNIPLKKNEFERLFRYLPTRYIIPYKIKNTNDLIEYKYKYAFPLLGNIFDDILTDCYNEINLDLFENNKNEQDMGWNFENLANNFFRLNSKPFPDLNMKIDQKIIVDSIYDFKNLKMNITNDDENLKLEENEYIYTISDNTQKQKLCKDIIKNEIIVISQNPCGESYDGALLIPLKNNKYGMLLYQVTLDRNKENFVYRDKIVDSLFKIKLRFETIFGISVSNFYFMYILYIQRKNATQVEKICNHFNNNLYYCYFDPSKKKLLNKNLGELKWELIKQKCRILHFSESYKNFNKNTHYFKEITDNTFKKITSMKLRDEKEIELNEDISNENNKKEIIDLLNLNISTNFGNSVKINYLNRKKKSEKEQDEPKGKKTSLNNKEEENDIKTNKNIEKGIIRRKYIENNAIKNISEIIPNMTEMEKQYVIKNNKGEDYSLTNDAEKTIQKILGINNNIEVIDRNFILLNTIKYDHNLALLYFNLTNNNAFIVVDENDTLKFYDLDKGNAIDASEMITIINDLIDINKIISTYVGYLLHIKK